MKNIYLVEYLNATTKNGEPTGHALNALNDDLNLFKGEETKYSVTIVASKKYLESFKNIKYISLKYSNSDTINNFLPFLYKNAFNIVHLLRMSNEGIYWFTNIEWTFLAILALLPKQIIRGKTIIITQFRDNYEDLNNTKKLRKLKKRLVEYSLKNRIAASINTAKIKNNYCRNIELPDFYYDPSKYAKYEVKEKSKIPLCIGTMSERKQILKLIDLFRSTDMKLEIIGHFVDNEYYNLCKNHATDNITITNKILNSEEYYSKIASHRFIILSYNMNDYKNATSGVLLETIYLKSVPVAPRKLLDFNHINGIGYETLSEIPSIIRENEDNSQMNIDNNLDHYSINYCKNKIFDLLEEIC